MVSSVLPEFTQENVRIYAAFSPIEIFFALDRSVDRLYIYRVKKFTDVDLVTRPEKNWCCRTILRPTADRTAGKRVSEGAYLAGIPMSQRVVFLLDSTPSLCGKIA